MNSETEPRYPNVTVKLAGKDGNAFAILGRVSAALKSHLREQGITHSERKAIANEFMAEATTSDYDHLLQTCMKWVSVK